MSKFFVIAGSRPKRAWAGVFPLVEGNWFHADSVAYYETGCSAWDECDCCEFDNNTNADAVLAKAGMVRTGKQIWIVDTLMLDGGMSVDEVRKA
jgi:hypothetical protein